MNVLGMWCVLSVLGVCVLGVCVCMHMHVYVRNICDICVCQDICPDGYLVVMHRRHLWGTVFSVYRKHCGVQSLDGGKESR